ncbi:hypothetical protein IAU60_004812 [Kwoniella sp. DSM 27419]
MSAPFDGQHSNTGHPPQAYSVPRPLPRSNIITQPQNTPDRRPATSGSLPPAAIASSVVPAKKARQKQPSFSDHAAADTSQDVSKVRAYAACRNCRTKKIKCLPGPPNTGVSSQPGPEGPAVPGPCQQCLQVGAECEYPPTRDRAAYSRQYVQNLETRVQALEALQARVLPLLEMFEGSPSGLPMPTALKRETRNSSSRLAAVDGPVTAVDSDAEVEAEAENEGDGEGDEEEGERAGSSSDVEDGGQMTQDERGNYRYIGSSNTLSLLDSFSHRGGDRERERERERASDKEQDAPGGQPSMTHRPSFTQRSSFNPSDPNSRQSPSISEQASRGPNPYFGPVAGSGVVKALPPVNEVQYPEPELAQEMIDAYFWEIHHCLPVLLEHDFRREYKRLMEDNAKGLSPSQESFLAVLFIVFALGERVIVTSRAWAREKKKVQNPVETGEETVLPGEAEAGVIWYERAQILHFTSFKDVNIHQVQCLTLMAAFQASVNAMPMSWLLAGQAVRVAQDLGLHRSTSRLPLSFAEKQLRSRCWWGIYGLERMMSIALGRPLGVDDLDIDVAYPAEIDDEGLEKLAQTGTPNSVSASTLEEPAGSTMSGFIALTKLCKIAGRVAHLLYRPANEKLVSDPAWAASQQSAINKLDKTLRDWLNNEVPTKYKDTSASRSISLVSATLSCSYFAILITLHRNFLPSNPDYPRPKPPPSSQSLARCVDAARSVIHIASQTRTQVPSSHHLAVYCQYLWSSAVILLLCEVQARDQVVMEAVGSHVESCRRSLQALEPVWPGSRKLKELLVDVANRAKEVATSAAKPSLKTGKKRKATMPDRRDSAANSESGLMRPPASRTQSHSASPTRSGASQSARHPLSAAYPTSLDRNPEKRQRMYETSDTRTLIVPQDVAAIHQGGSTEQSSFYSLPPYPSATSTGHDGALGHAPGSLGLDGVYDSFDLGGVSFNPSELLQGFGDSASSFWNNMTFTPGSGTGSAADAHYPAAASATTGMTVGGAPTHPPGFSGHNTPNSAAGSGPSPLGDGRQLQLTPQSQAGVGPNQHTPQPGDGTDPFSEFWAQVAGNSFDWQADPSVPFNI